MSKKDRGWELRNLVIPEGTCPTCPYRTSIFRTSDRKVPSTACLLRIYTTRGHIGVARAFNRGIPEDCEYLNEDEIA